MAAQPLKMLSNTRGLIFISNYLVTKYLVTVFQCIMDSCYVKEFKVAIFIQQFYKAKITFNFIFENCSYLASVSFILTLLKLTKKSITLGQAYDLVNIVPDGSGK